MQEMLESKNTYMHHFKLDSVKDREGEEEKTRTQFLYDTSKGIKEHQNYCQKCKYESQWCKHRKEREVAKQQLGAAITT